MEDLRLRYKDKLDGDGPLMAVCPIHGDTNPSLAIYSEHAFCFGCRAYWKAGEFTYKSVKVAYQSHTWKRPDFLPVSLANTYHNWLYNYYPSKLEWYYGRGFTDATIKHFCFGHCPGAFTIPIFSVSKQLLRQMRFRRDDSEGTDGPKYYGICGANNTALYLDYHLLMPRKEVYLCEGELKAARLNQEGLPAVSLTNGAGSFSNSLSKYFTDVEVVYVAFDQDAAGELGANKVKELLGEKVKILRWPYGWGKGVDDFIQNKGIGEFKNAITK